MGHSGRGEFRHREPSRWGSALRAHVRGERAERWVKAQENGQGQIRAPDATVRSLEDSILHMGNRRGKLVKGGSVMVAWSDFRVSPLDHCNCIPCLRGETRGPGGMVTVRKGGYPSGEVSVKPRLKGPSV